VYPAAVAMAYFLLENPNLLKGKKVLELGSGVGVTGLVASKLCKQIVLTDNQEEVLYLLERNIQENLCSLEFALSVLNSCRQCLCSTTFLGRFS